MEDLTFNYLMEVQIRSKRPIGMRLCQGLFFYILASARLHFDPGINLKNILSCQGQGGNWRTYAAVVWEAPYHYDKGK